MDISDVMLKIALFCLLLVGSTQSAIAQETDVRFMSPDSLQAMEKATTSDYHFFSFWASWCAPCFKEIKLLKEVKANCDCDMALYFINVDKPGRRKTALKKAARWSMGEDLYFATPPLTNFYSDVNAHWSGELPALLMVRPSDGNRLFFNRLVRKKEVMRFMDGSGN